MSATTVAFPAGETEISFTVTTVQDVLAERFEETFQITLANPSQGLGIDAQSTATVTIRDDEGEIPPTIREDNFRFCSFTQYKGVYNYYGL